MECFATLGELSPPMSFHVEGESILTVLKQDLYQELDDGSPSVMPNHHLIFNTNYATR